MCEPQSQSNSTRPDWDAHLAIGQFYITGACNFKFGQSGTRTLDLLLLAHVQSMDMFGTCIALCKAEDKTAELILARARSNTDG